MTMWTNTKQNHLKAILTHPGVTHIKITKFKYLLRYNIHQWYLWPYSGRYQEITLGGHTSEIFIGELKEFYHRHLTGTLLLPENFGKMWSQDDESTLFEMIVYYCSIREIAKELKRHPISVATKLASFLDDENLLKNLTENMFDVPIREFPGFANANAKCFSVYPI